MLKESAKRIREEYYTEEDLKEDFQATISYQGFNVDEDTWKFFIEEVTLFESNSETLEFFITFNTGQSLEYYHEIPGLFGSTEIYTLKLDGEDISYYNWTVTENYNDIMKRIAFNYIKELSL